LSSAKGGRKTMTKKLKSGLAPLLVIAAFVMTPAPALGSAEIVWPGCEPPKCPHVYKNGVISHEGKPLRTIAWGNLKFLSQKSGESECNSIWAGSLVNPVGGGRAAGKVGAWYAYACTDPTCEASLGTLRAKPGDTLPWRAEVVENASKEFFQK